MKYMIVCLLVLVSFAWADDPEWGAAVRLIRDGKYEVAETLIESYLEKNGPSVRFYYALGYCDEKMDRIDDAVGNYCLALRVHYETFEETNYAENVQDRLAGLAPAIVGTMRQVWDLRDRADRSEGREKAYYAQAAKVLMEHTLNPASWREAKAIADEGAEVPVVGETKIPDDALTYNGHRYKVIKLERPITWEEAQERCEEMGGYLVCVNDEREHQWLMKNIYTDVISAFIGLHEKFNRWRWVDGRPAYFENWHHNRESKEISSNRAISVMGRKREDGRHCGEWNNVPRNRKVNQFICEWE